MVHPIPVRLQSVIFCFLEAKSYITHMGESGKVLRVATHPNLDTHGPLISFSLSTLHPLCFCIFASPSLPPSSHLILSHFPYLTYTLSVSLLPASSLPILYPCSPSLAPPLSLTHCLSLTLPLFPLPLISPACHSSSLNFSLLFSLSTPSISLPLLSYLSSILPRSHSHSLSHSLIFSFTLHLSHSCSLPLSPSHLLSPLFTLSLRSTHSYPFDTKQINTNTLKKNL